MNMNCLVGDHDYKILGSTSMYPAESYTKLLCRLCDHRALAKEIKQYEFMITRDAACVCEYCVITPEGMLR